MSFRPGKPLDRTCIDIWGRKTSPVYNVRDDVVYDKKKVYATTNSTDEHKGLILNEVMKIVERWALNDSYGGEAVLYTKKKVLPDDLDKCFEINI